MKSIAIILNQTLIGTEYVRSDIFCSDMNARYSIGKLLVEECSKRWGRTLERTARGKRPTYFAFATFIDSSWNCSDRAPAINIAAVRQKVATAIRREGLDGIAVIEVQPLCNYPEQGLGRSLMANVHALVWSRQEIDISGWTKRINGSASWRADFGCPSLHVMALEEDTLDNRVNIERVVTYMIKPPHDAKYFKPQKQNPGHYKFQTCVEKYPPNLALRVLECLSYIRMFDVVFGVGSEGKRWCNAWRKRARLWLKLRLANEAPHAVDPAEFWARYRRETGTEKFKPFRLLNGSEKGRGLVYRGDANDPAKPVRVRKRRTSSTTTSSPEGKKATDHTPRRRGPRRGSYRRLLAVTNVPSL